MSYHCRETQRILSDFSEAELPSVERSADVPDRREGDLTKHPQKRGEAHDHKNKSRWNTTLPYHEPVLYHCTMAADS